MTDYKQLCVELTDALDSLNCNFNIPNQSELVERACVALAEPQPAADGEAAEPSNENCWQWYTYCPEEGLEIYSDREQAQSAAQSIMGSYEVAAYSDGWHEDMESVSWGMLVPVEQAQVVERKTAEPGDEFDEWVTYELRPALWGNHPGSPDSSHQPTPVSERLPEAEDCDAEGRCWWYGDGEDLVSHWLPANALHQPT